jgi:replicative DNA helicase
LKICEILVERFGLEKELSKNHFSLTDAKTLYNDEFNDFKFIVSSLLPQGLSILAGSPKIGKSGLCCGFAFKFPMVKKFGNTKP